MISELAVVDDVVEAVTERDASDAVAGFAVDTFVELVTSEAITGLVDVATEFAGAELEALVEAGATEFAGAELEALVEAGATELVGSTAVAATVSATAGATVVVDTLSGAVIGEVSAGTPSP